MTRQGTPDFQPFNSLEGLADEVPGDKREVAVCVLEGNSENRCPAPTALRRGPLSSAFRTGADSTSNPGHPTSSTRLIVGLVDEILGDRGWEVRGMVEGNSENRCPRSIQSESAGPAVTSLLLGVIFPGSFRPIK